MRKMHHFSHRALSRQPVFQGTPDKDLIKGLKSVFFLKKGLIKPYFYNFCKGKPVPGTMMEMA